MSPLDKTRLRLLHLEDNRRDALLAADQLKYEWPACEIIQVASRQEFTAALHELPFDVIISDYTLVDFDGRVALTLAREHRPEVPFIFFSGTIGEERAVEALKSGATDYVIKDQPARLVSAIRRALHDAEIRESQRTAEIALRESERKFAKAFRAVPDAVLITELATGRVVDANEGCERLYGYRLDECIGRSTTELGIWHDADGRERLLETLRREGGVVRNLGLRGRTRSGDTVDVEVSCETIEFSGRPHLVTIVHDVTEQKRAERALRESEAKFNQAFRASPWAVGLTDAQTWSFVEVNDSYCRMFGYTREELIGRSAADLGLWGSPRERDEFLQAFSRHGSVPEMEISGRRRDGATITCLLRGECVEMGGRLHLITALYDITARRQTEKARAALEEQLRQAQKVDALGQLAGGVAHDFNNLLTGIVGCTDLAIMDIDRPALAREHLAMVRRTCQRATELVRQILSFSRHKPFERVPVHLDRVVSEALKLLRATLPKSIEIVEVVELGTPVILADSTQIHQVMMNLATNAAHAMRDKYGRLTVRVDAVTVPQPAPEGRPRLEPGRYARLRVTDEGHGMDAETLARIFEPFFTTKPSGVGTGLGLAVVHGIVEDHDGVITVDSQPGEGTTFGLYFPEHASGSLAATDAASDLPHGNGQHILLIDDDLSVVRAATDVMRRFGYKVTSYTDPRAAWQEFDARSAIFDAAVVDTSMPHLGGVELVDRMLRKRPALPIIMISGHNAAGTAEPLRSLGIRTMVLKPLSAAKLLGVLRDALAPR
jgi:two-component system, cell cycle sensor histidine kinase and response regulator CckA